MDYHEVGRSISTLMADKHFQEVAYSAHSRGQLLSAINEFLNRSIVLPPGEWSSPDLILVDQVREKAQVMIKKKDTGKQKKMEAVPGQFCLKSIHTPIILSNDSNFDGENYM